MATRNKFVTIIVLLVTIIAIVLSTLIVLYVVNGFDINPIIKVIIKAVLILGLAYFIGKKGVQFYDKLP